MGLLRRVNAVPLLLLSGLLAAGLQAPVATPAVTPAAVADYQPTFPMNVTNFYAVATDSPYRVHPAKANYNDVDVIAKQVAEMQYAGQQVATYAWFGRGSYPDTVFANALRAADDTSFRWAIFYELEGPSGLNHGNPTPAQIKADLDHIYSRYGKDKSYLRVGGKPVVFVYHDAADRCGPAARFTQADPSRRFYFVQHWVPGYTACRPQPSSWHIYAPAAGHTAIGTSGYAVSPGYNAYRDKAPKLARSVSRFTADLRAMKASRTQWHLTTTWNEWSEGTGVENAAEWRSRSGHGAYVDAMHAVLGTAPSTPLPPARVTVTNGPQVTVSWSASSGATSYQVLRNGCLVATQAGRTWTDPTLTDASASYVVRSVSSRGNGKPTAPVYATAGAPVPAAASTGEGLVATPATRVLSTATGLGVGCASRQHGRFVLTLPDAVPADATAVVLGLTTSSTFGAGSVQAFPMGTDAPPVHLVRYVARASNSSTALVPIGTGRQVVLQTTGAATHLSADVLGYTAPGGGSLTSYTSKRFADTHGGFGGVPNGLVNGGFLAQLPAYVPVNATAVQLKVRTFGASAAGSVTPYAAGAAVPTGTGMVYGAGGLTAGSVLAPVHGHAITVRTTSPTYVQLGIDGWVVPGTAHLVTTGTATRLVATPTQTSSRAIQMPAGAAGKVALLSVTAANPTASTQASVYPDGAAAPELTTLSFGAAQPQTSLVWVHVPANGLVRVQLRAPAQLWVDVLGLA